MWKPGHLLIVKRKSIPSLHVTEATLANISEPSLLLTYRSGVGVNISKQGRENPCPEELDHRSVQFLPDNQGLLRVPQSP